jgi:hypothetical protein
MEKNQRAMEAILAKRFSPFDFSRIDDYPHLVPPINKWDD